MNKGGVQPKFDWAHGRALFEVQHKSMAQIAKALGCSDTAVAKVANKEGWQRDPEAVKDIAAKRDALIAEKLEREHARVVAITAAMQSEVLVAHRADILRARKLVSSLLDELTQVSSETALFRELGELMHAPDERGLDRLNKAYQRVISIPERATSLNTLATALRTLVLLERQAFNIEGAIIDPAEKEETGAQVVKGLDKIMDKFNEVLALQAPVPPSQAAETLTKFVEVVDVPTSTQAATT